MAAAILPAVRKRAFSLATSRVQARAMATSGGEAWGKASEISEQLGSIMKKEMNQANWTHARSTWENLSKVLKDSPETLTLQDIKLSQLQSEVYQLKADSKFSTNISYAVYGIFGCFLIGMPFQVLYGDLKLKSEIDLLRNNNEGTSVEIEKKTKKSGDEGNNTAVEEVGVSA